MPAAATSLITARSFVITSFYATAYPLQVASLKVRAAPLCATGWTSPALAAASPARRQCSSCVLCEHRGISDDYWAFHQQRELERNHLQNHADSELHELRMAA
jgi:hypothetical protein